MLHIVFHHWNCEGVVELTHDEIAFGWILAQLLQADTCHFQSQQERRMKLAPTEKGANLCFFLLEECSRGKRRRTDNLIGCHDLP